MLWGLLNKASGQDNPLRIDARNAAKMYGESDTLFQTIVLDSRGFNVSTGLFTLTSGSPSAVLYIDYQDQAGPLALKALGVRLFTPVGATGPATVRILSGSSSSADGTIVTDRTPLPVVVNRDRRSKRALEGSQFLGGEGKTLTGVDEVIASSASEDYAMPLRFEDEIFLFGADQFLGVEITPPAGITSQSFVVFATLGVKRNFEF